MALMADAPIPDQGPPRMWARIGVGRTPASAGIEAWMVALRIGANGLVAAPRRSETGELVVGQARGRLGRRSLFLPLEALWEALAEMAIPTGPGADARPAGAPEMALDLSGIDAPTVAELDRELVQARVRGFSGRIWLVGQDAQLLVELGSSSGRRGSIGTLHITDPRSSNKGAEAHAAWLRQVGIDGVLAPEEHTSAGLVALMHRFRRLLVADGADFRRTARRALGHGVDGVVGTDAEALHDGWQDLSEGR